ncbi:MAG: hypothetical protein V4710_02000 [Verrucomicrobiota bacterium]
MKRPEATLPGVLNEGSVSQALVADRDGDQGFTARQPRAGDRREGEISLTFGPE